MGGELLVLFTLHGRAQRGSLLLSISGKLLARHREEFWHAGVKWDYSVPFEFRELKDAELVQRLQDIGRKFYLAMGCTGYGRCDVRMRENGELVMLEINPNGGVLYRPEEYGPADFMILYDKDGYYGFFDRIFRAALVRKQSRQGNRGRSKQGNK